MATACGWAGSILHINLTDKKISRNPTSDFEPAKYIGGVGLNSKIFWELGCPKIDAFHPDSPLILSNGPLTGASGPFTRATMSGIAPQSYPEELFAYSGLGGKFPSELKYAGYDGIVIVGRSDEPAYLSIDDGDVQIRDAGDLWGLDTFEAQKTLTDRHPRGSVLCIGPAGENLSRIAIVINESSGAAGQGGYGAVMGSKNLKAIVTRGSGTLKVARPGDFMELIHERKAAGEWVAGPTQENQRYAIMWGPVRKKMAEKYLRKPSGCYACPYQCHGFYDIAALGKGAMMCTDSWYLPFCGDNAEAMWEGNLLSQKLGINNFDLMNFGFFLSRCIAEGVLTKADTGLSSIPFAEKGREPPPDDRESYHIFLEELLGGIADGSSVFSQGAARAAEYFGKKAMDIYESFSPARGYRFHHIRGVGEALHWATDSRDPFNSSHDYVTFGLYERIADWFGVPGGYLVGEGEGKNRNIYEGIEKETLWVQHHQSLKNALLMCNFAALPALYFHPPEMDIGIFESRLLSTVTGLEVDKAQLWEAGERICNLRRAIMVLREDRHRDDDTVNDTLFREIGPIAIERLPAPLERGRWEAVKDRYYELRGWDVETGVPTRGKLEALDMRAVADKLESAGRI